jgi:hypothetical protein
VDVDGRLDLVQGDVARRFQWDLALDGERLGVEDSDGAVVAGGSISGGE